VHGGASTVVVGSPMWSDA